MDFDAAGNYCLYVTTMKAMNVQNDNPSTPFDNLKDHYVVVFSFTST